VLDDGRRVVIKLSDPRTDLTARLDEGAEGRELRLWETRVLDRLPASLAHAILAAGRVGEEVVTVMRDLGPHVLSWDDRLTPPELRRVFGAVAALHRAFQGQPPPGLCPLTTRLSLFAPERMRRHLRTGNPLPALVLRGWELFDDLAPQDVAVEVFDTLSRPERLARALAGAPLALLHGDLWLVNVALGPEDVVLLDWGLATAGPAVLDFVTFVVGSASHIALAREALEAGLIA
jgi:Phosphotransferase enzyme family